jgi:ribosomal protein S6
VDEGVAVAVICDDCLPYYVALFKVPIHPSNMVFYECVVTAKNTTRKDCPTLFEMFVLGLLYPHLHFILFCGCPLDFHVLSAIMKKVSLEIVKGGGIVRAVHNHGIRSLPHRFRAKYPDKEGNRYYSKGRFISIYYDSNPATMKQVEQALTLQEEVLRKTHLKARSILDFVNVSREERNPYITEVKRLQSLDRAAAHHRNETVEQVIEDMRFDDA